MLNSRLQALLQRSVAMYLKDRCAIQRSIVTPDEYGGEGTPVWHIVAGSVPCRLITIGIMSASQVQDAGQQESLQDRFRMILPSDQLVEVDYRIQHRGIYYGVVGIQSELSDELYTSVVLQRSRGADHV